MQDLLAFTFAVGGDDSSVVFDLVERRVFEWAWTRTGEPVPDTSVSDGLARAGGGQELRWSRMDTANQSERALEVELVHPDEKDPGLRWRSTVELTLIDGAIRVGVHVAREAITLVMRPASVELGTPRVVHALITGFPCFAGGLRLSGEAEVTAPGDVEHLVDMLRTGPPQRALPLVVVAPRDGSPSPHAIAARLAGLAHVAALTGYLAYRRLVEAEPDAFTPPGGVRVYWPGYGSGADALHHPYWTAARIDAGRLPIEDELFRMLSRVSVLRVPRDPALRRLRAEARFRRREVIQTTDGDVSAYKDLLDEVEKDLAKLERENLELEAKAANLEDALTTAEKNLEAAWGSYGTEAGANTERDGSELEPPRTWDAFADRLHELETRSDGSLVFTATAVATARSTGYPDPQRMWQTLEALEEAARAYRAAGAAVGERMDSWFIVHFGLDYAAKDSNLRGLAKFDFEGRQWSREPHIKVDDAKHGLEQTGRVYFALDADGFRFVVDHIGGKLAR